MRPRFKHAVLAAGLALVAIARHADAQEMPEGHHPPSADSAASRPTFNLGASAIVLGTIAAPGVRDRTLAEGYLTQPMLMAMLMSANGKLSADLTLNFEGTTLQRGELNAGMYGEGYIDRRHPHTLLHELVATARFGGGLSRFSATVGKGFVPFGTDDPMSRPFVKYPVNHHLAQLLERVVGIAAVASGPLVLEVAAFNGDEPESPSDMPNWSRLADSWAGRMTLQNRGGVELQASLARVASPEQPHGGGLNHQKLSTSARYERNGLYFLGEWAKTRETERGRSVFTFRSLLAEGALTRRAFTVAMRAERTERPEEERLENVFRTPRPHSDLSIVGRTRWSVLTVRGSTSTSVRRLATVSPFVEISTQRPREINTPAVFQPREFYGAETLWSFSAGIKLGVGMQHSRMGRYGVAAEQHHVKANDSPSGEHIH